MTMKRVSTKKTACSFFAKGACRNGASCSFVHAEPPRASGSVTAAASSPHTASAVLPPRGLPPLPMAHHSREEDRLPTLASSDFDDGDGGGEPAPGAGASDGNPKAARKPCKFLALEGFCRKGSKCKFLHAGPGLGNNSAAIAVAASTGTASGAATGATKKNSGDSQILAAAAPLPRAPFPTAVALPTVKPKKTLRLRTKCRFFAKV